MLFSHKLNGSVSIFLSILLAVMSLLAAIFVDGARMRICETEAQSAADSSARSALAGYDGILKEIYGLFALAEGNSEVLNDEVRNYLNKILLTELGMDESSMEEKVFNYLKKLFTGQEEYENVNFANLFDYRLENVSVMPIYSLVDNRILKSQILKYMKYRAPVNITKDLTDKFLSFIQFGKQSQLIGKKVKLDRELYDVSKKQSELATLTEEVSVTNSEASLYISDKLNVYNELIKLKDENVDNYKQEIESYIEALHNKYDLAVKCVEDLKSTAGKSNQMIKNFYEVELKEDDSDFAEKLRYELKEKEEEISNVRLDELENNLNEKKSVLSALGNALKDSHTELLPDNILGLTAVLTNPAKSLVKYTFEGAEAQNSDSIQEDPRISAKEALELSLVSMKKSTTQVNNSTILEDLVSKNKTKILEQEKELVSSLYLADAEYMAKVYKRNTSQIEEMIYNDAEPVTINDETTIQLLDEIDYSEKGNIEEGFNLVTLLSDGLSRISTNILDSMYLNEYIDEKFKNALTITENNNKQTHFDAEVEYILIGKTNDNSNKYIIQGQILLLRFALNTIHIYMDQAKTNQALAAATAIAGWTGFGVPIVQTIIMMAWSMSESILDVKYLMSGKQIPVIKTNQTWMLGSLGSIKSVLLEAMKEASMVAIDSVAEYAQIEVEKLAENIVCKVDSIVEQSIDDAIDKVFTPIEALLMNTGLFEDENNFGNQNGSLESENDNSENQSDNSESEGDSSQSQSSSLAESPIMENLMNLIESVVGEEYEKIGQDLQSFEINSSRDIVQNYILSKKDEIKVVAVSKVKDLKECIVNEINEAAKKGKNEFDKYLDRVFSRQAKIDFTKETHPNTITMGYIDYLKLFLLIKGENIKLERIQDLIQLNMRKESDNPEFLLQEYYTCIRADITVSISRIFAVGFSSSKNINSSRKRYSFRYVIYDSY